ncbi:hypothetical protein D3C84_1129330 [compost metagenome]
MVALDHPALLQLADALAHRRTRQVDRAGDLADGSAGVLAQQGDDLVVELVHGGSRAEVSLSGNSATLPANDGRLTAAPNRRAT